VTAAEKAALKQVINLNQASSSVGLPAVVLRIGWFEIRI
jgi:hypothetical protein